jgi:hypothetical protein
VAWLNAMTNLSIKDGKLKFYPFASVYHFFFLADMERNPAGVSNSSKGG